MARRPSHHRTPSRRRHGNASRSNPSAAAYDGLLVAGVALGTAGAVLWWASRDSDAQAATLPTAPSPAPQPAARPPQGPRTAVIGERFHLRPTATAASMGPVLPATTRVTLLEQTRLRRSRATLWRVRLANGQQGYAFVLPEEIRP